MEKANPVKKKSPLKALIGLIPAVLKVVPVGARIPLSLFALCILMLAIVTWGGTGFRGWIVIILLVSVALIALIWLYMEYRRVVVFSERERVMVVKLYNLEKKSQLLSRAIHESQGSVLDLLGKIVK